MNKFRSCFQNLLFYVTDHNRRVQKKITKKPNMILFNSELFRRAPILLRETLIHGCVFIKLLDSLTTRTNQNFSPSKSLWRASDWRRVSVTASRIFFRVRSYNPIREDFLETGIVFKSIHPERETEKTPTVFICHYYLVVLKIQIYFILPTGCLVF